MSVDTNAQGAPDCPGCGHPGSPSGDAYFCWSETCRVKLIDDEGNSLSEYGEVLDEETLASVKRAKRELEGTPFSVSKEIPLEEVGP